MNLRQRLRTTYAARLSRNSGYSLRAYARDLGVSPAGLSQILSGKQGVSSKKAEQLAKRLGLSARETEALVLDTTRAHGRSRTARTVAAQEIKRREVDPSQHMLTLDLFQAVSDWWHWALIEVAQLENHATAEALAASSAQRLGLPQVTLLESVGRLLKLEVLGQDGSFIKPRKDTRIVPAGVPSEAIRKLHGQVLEKAQNALAFQTTEERDFGASFLSIDPRAMPLLKEKMRKFRREVIEEFGQSQANPDAQIYSLGTQVFRAEV